MKVTQSVNAQPVEPEPSPTPSPEPVVKPVATVMKKSTISCVKGKITKKVSAVSPKCPAGYKKK